MNKYWYSLGLMLSLSFSANAQKQDIESKFDNKRAIDHFTYLASDDLMGRYPIRPEISLAYNYIADQLKDAGAKPLPGADGYFQNIPFVLSAPPTTGQITLGDSIYTQGNNLLVINGESLSGEYELVDVGYGMESDYEGKDLEGKIAVTNVGAPDRFGPADLFSLGAQKKTFAMKSGAVGIIERFNVPSVPWQLVSNFLNRSQLSVGDGNSDPLPYLWIKDLGNDLKEVLASGDANAQVEIEGKVNKTIEGKNVMAFIEGTDPELKNEYVMLSAHYDHVGVGQPDASGDTIYNGARDNAVGTVAVINAANYLAQNPPKRSVLLALWTAEEKGLLGSAYFAENPLIPLDQIIYNLNIDNGGYNDTSVITVIGLGRTSGDQEIVEAVEAFGLKAIEDPSPAQGLYDRSDNVNFAKKGIPAPTFSLGFTAFDDEINKYYHKAGDSVESFDLDYAVLYWKAYILAAQNMANISERPKWVEGDKYEEVGKALYGDQK